MSESQREPLRTSFAGRVLVAYATHLHIRFHQRRSADMHLGTPVLPFGGDSSLQQNSSAFDKSKIDGQSDFH
jgi:hypothetical protein